MEIRAFLSLQVFQYSWLTRPPEDDDEVARGWSWLRSVHYYVEKNQRIKWLTNQEDEMAIGMKSD